MNDFLRKWNPPMGLYFEVETDPAPSGKGNPLPPTDPGPVNFDRLMNEISQLTSTIQEHGGNFSTLDIPGLEKSFQGMMTQLEAWQAAQDPAVRMGLAGNYQTDEALQRVKSLAPGNKFKSLAYDIVRDGSKKMGRFNVTGADVVLTHHFLSAIERLKMSGERLAGAEKFKPPSEDLKAVTAALLGVESYQKLMDSGTSGAGAELVPTGLQAELWEDFFSASKVVADMPVIQMPTDPFEVPLGLGDPTWRKGTGGVPVSSQNLSTAKKTLTSTELVVDIAWTYDLDELSIIAMMPTVRATINRSGAEQMDAFVLNADDTSAATGNINSDDAAPSGDAYYLSDGEDGIRHFAIVDNTNQLVNVGAALSDTKMATLLQTLGKYALDYNNVRIVPEITTYFTMLGMTNVATVDKYSQFATIARGELGRYRGIPIIPSASMPKTEADGKVSATASNNTLGQLAIYHKDMWLAGFARTLLIEADRDIRSRQLIMVASFKIAVDCHGTRASTSHTVVGRNVTIS